MIKVIEHGEIRELRIERPPANALSPDLLAALSQAVGAAPSAGARAIVISGIPGMFSAGLDVPLLLTLDKHTLAQAWRDLYGMMRSIACSEIPIAAAITGHAPAGGTVIALFCDYRVAADGDWKLGVNEVRIGLPLPPIIISALRREVGARETERLAVNGPLISPAEALCCGLVHETVPLEQVVQRAVDWCSDVLAVPAVSMLPTRESARADLHQLFRRDLDEEIATMSAAWWNEETQAALRVMVARIKKK
jgi:3,2-trans-enoyl-CoA isomerase